MQLLKIIMQSYEEKVFSADYYAAGIGLTARNLGNILGNMNRCEEALSVADYGIHWTLRKGTGAVLGVLLYDRGWDMEQLNKKTYISVWYHGCAVCNEWLCRGKAGKGRFARDCHNAGG